MVAKTLERVVRQPWIWSAAGSALLWLLTAGISGRGLFGSLIANAAIASFLVVVSLGQMFTVTTGEGGIDLSIPYVMTLSAFISVAVMDGSNYHFVYALLLAICLGSVVGLVNALLILGLRIPPIIATMSMGFVMNSAAILYSNKLTSFSPSPLLTTLTQGRLAGIPIILICVVCISILVAFILRRTVFGRSIFAVGQNRVAARMAGVRTTRIVSVAYLISGSMAGLGGFLLAGRDGGAFMQMGNPYLLESVGAVVIGGTLISGGKSTVVGTLFGALFLVLVVTLMEITRFPTGIQEVIQGIVILGVLTMANQDSRITA